MNASFITSKLLDLFDPKRNAVCPNVSWGLLPWEADVLVVSRARVVTEIEIKVSKADLENDRLKKKWSVNAWDPRRRVHKFYYAVPKKLEVPARVRAAEIGAGVIVVHDSGDRLGHLPPEIIIPAKRWEGPSKERAEKMRVEVYRLVSLRYWDAFKKKMGVTEWSRN